MHASTAVRFEESYRQIAQQVQLGHLFDPKADVLSMVHGWLSNESNGKWVMVVDNADSEDVLFALPETSSSMAFTQAHALSNYFPTSDNGCILITTRSRRVAEGLIEYVDDIVDVEPMMMNEATVLFDKKSRRQTQTRDQDDVSQLVQELDCMPLAVSQAAAYINQRAPRMTVSQYLVELKRGGTDQADLLRHDIRDPRRDGRASNSIIATWHLSFEHIRQTRSSAAQLLALMCLFDREAIPAYMLSGQYSAQRATGEPNAIASAQDQKQFEEDVLLLRAYSLIAVGAPEDRFNMHRLVQFSIKEWLKLHNELEKWQTIFARILRNTFPTGEHENWSMCQALLPHLEALMSYRVENKIFLQSWATVAFRGAWYTWRSGKYDVAENLVRASLQIREQAYGPEDVATLQSVYLLSAILIWQGKYAESEKITRWMLAAYSKLFGPGYQKTLSSVNHLALALRGQGKYEEAEEVSRHLSSDSERILGPDHPDTLVFINNLALVLRDQRKYSEAEEIYRQVSSKSERVFGADNPDTLHSLNNLTQVLRDQGKIDQAEETNKRALFKGERLVAEDHPFMLHILSDSASLLRDRGKYEEAEWIHRRVLSKRERLFRPNHPHILGSISCLALTLKDQGRYSEAEGMIRHVIAVREKVFGQEHPKTLESISDLESLLRDQIKHETTKKTG